jgi:hypothetical protein
MRGVEYAKTHAEPLGFFFLFFLLVFVLSIFMEVD